METKDMKTQNQEQRKRMIESIIKIIEQTNDKKLQDIYDFVLHIR